MRSQVRTLILAAIIAAAPAGAALAHRGGDDSRPAAGFAVTQGEAAAIARAEGMVQIYETKARRGVWKMEGVDASGIKIEVSVDGRTGEVVKVERYGPGTRHSGSDDRRPN
ncbi:PepSY domain-containing protein [Hyphomonas sp.]|uniref:PepSY domain-containing protein n=1 Tax=Hyphomonas sp. TaxID=87 RepID=UPI00391DBE51